MLRKTLFTAAAIGLILGTLTACGGGGGSSSNNTPPPTTVAPPPPTTPTPPPTPPSTAPVTISGTVTFDRVPFNAANRLDYDSITRDPIRGVVVRAVNASNQVLVSGFSDASGAYSLEVPGNTDVRIQVVSALQRVTGQTFDFEVRNNSSGDALYVLGGTLTSSGGSDSVRNLNAGSGWTGTNYGGIRSAAPFAILDTIYEATDLIVTTDPDVQLAPLDIFWSTDNFIGVGEGIGSGTFFTNEGGQNVISLVGGENSDTDEYDEHIVVHEFMHYLERQIFRGDSVGGPHALGERLDKRLAYSEGLATSFSGMALDEPLYRDSLGNQQAGTFIIDNENETAPPAGWFNEGTILTVIYDFFDAESDGADQVSLGFGPIYAALTSPQYQDMAELSSIFGLVEALLAQPGVDAAGIEAILTAANINSLVADGTGETNNGGIATALPLYHSISVGGPAVEVCSFNTAGTPNNLANYNFLLFNLASAQSVTINANVTSASGGTSDPAIQVFTGGETVGFRDVIQPNRESLTVQLAAGEYSIQIYDASNVVPEDDDDGGNFCFDVTIQ